ncbi:MAG: response regulator [Caldilineaceae bacterium]
MTTILLVDDDALLRRSLKYQLEQAGYRVLTAETGQAAMTWRPSRWT